MSQRCPTVNVMVTDIPNVQNYEIRCLIVKELEPLGPVVKSQIFTKVQHLKFGVCRWFFFHLFCF